MTAFILGGDVDAAASAAEVAARFNQNHDAEEVALNVIEQFIGVVWMSGQKIYKVIDENGKVKLTESCPPSQGLYCDGVVGDVNKLTELEKQFKREREEAEDASTAHAWYCLGRIG